jgi:hypothetical protein
VFINAMSEPRTKPPTARRRAAYAVAFAALCAALVMVVAMPIAGASKAKVIGHTKHTPKASCPNIKDTSHCNVIGRVTGFMTAADGRKQPFRVPSDGKLVAWAVDLGKPVNKHKGQKLGQRKFFASLFENKQYGKQPTGRIAVLKHKGGVQYKLMHQSPVVQLGGVLGRKQIFTLNKPLTVRKGTIVAFTSPTWTPDFTDVNVSGNGNKWRSSRKKGHCQPRHNTDTAKHRFARNSHAQQKVRSVRDYECSYTGGRILYWAYFTPKSK